MPWRGVLLFCVIITGVHSISTHDITPCYKYDSTCHTKNANTLYRLSIDGDPKLGIQPLDSMYQKYIEGKLAIIKYVLLNSTVIGFDRCKVVDTQVNWQNSTIGFNLVCPYFDMYGDYQMSGKLIIFPIEGSGKYQLVCKDYRVHVDTEIKVTQADDGKRYMAYKRFKVAGELEGGMVVNMTNLFNGQNEPLARTVLHFANQEWRIVSKELQQPVFNANVMRLIQNFNKYLKHVSLDQLIVQ